MRYFGKALEKVVLNQMCQTETEHMVCSLDVDDDLARGARQRLSTWFIVCTQMILLSRSASKRLSTWFIILQMICLTRGASQRLSTQTLDMDNKYQDARQRLCIMNMTKHLFNPWIYKYSYQIKYLVHTYETFTSIHFTMVVHSEVYIHMTRYVSGSGQSELVGK